MNATAARPEFQAHYRVESFVPLDKVSEVIVGEQSSGTFLRLAGETDELRQRSRARMGSIAPEESVNAPSLHSEHVQRSGPAGALVRGRIKIAFPIANVGADLSALLATVAGNLFELGEVTGLNLLDLELPDDYMASFPGPAFGVPGTRRLAGVQGRPLDHAGSHAELRAAIDAFGSR